MSRRERGHLEAEVMQLLWSNPGGLTSAQLETAFTERRRPARTTLLTVLSRLEDKDLVARTSAPGGAVFRATQAQSEHVASSMARLLESSADRNSALTHFVGSLSEQDLDMLRKLSGP